MADSGTIKWFSNLKGFGFILDDDGQDIFVHYSAIEIQGYKTLKSGQIVDYDVKNGDKGKHAVNVVPRDEDDLKRTKRSS